MHNDIKNMLEIKKARLLLYHEAEAAILSGQSYEIEGLRLTRAELQVVADMIAKLEKEVIRLENMLLASKSQRTRFKVVIPGSDLRTCR